MADLEGYGDSLLSTDVVIMTTAITAQFTLDPDDFADIICTAGFACDYWADQLTCNSDDTADVVFDDDNGKRVKRSISLSKVEAVIAQIASGQSSSKNPSIQAAFKQLVYEDNAGEVDIAAADALIQLCVFGEIIYG